MLFGIYCYKESEMLMEILRKISKKYCFLTESMI